MLPYVAFMLFAALAAATRRAFPLLWPLFIVAVLVFVGLRFETAFDWPIYKNEFDTLANSRLDVGTILWARTNWGHEWGYVVLAGIAAKILPAYEWFQLAVFVFFLGSTRYLTRSLGHEREPWALYVILGFLMFSLIMSTMRQCVSISVFNIGLGMMLRRRPGGMAVVLASLAFHISGLIYIAALLASRVRIPNRPVYVSIVALFASLFANAAIWAAATYRILPKLDYYLSQDRQVSYYEVSFFVVSMVVIFVFSVRTLAAIEDERRAVLVRFCAISAALGVALLGITTLRNRVFYELVIVVAVLIPYYRNPGIFRLAMVALSSFFFLAQFARLTAIGFVPYQNYLVRQWTRIPGDGMARQQEVRRVTRIRRD